MPDKPIFPTPQDAEAAFYDALERGDLEAMMAVWSDDDEITCVHPGGPRLVGYAAIRESWRRIFDGGARLQVRLSQTTVVQGPFTSLHSVIEHISVRDDESIRAPVVATNFYVRGPLGWRMALHHGSPAPPEPPADPSKKTLH